MKIGIITLYDNGNIGAALQAYALNRVLRDMGNCCETIRYRRLCEGKTDAEINKEKRMELLKSRIGRREFMFKAIISLTTRHKRRLRGDGIHSFVEKNIPQSTTLYTGVQHVQAVNSLYDGFICGSDNIWNKNRFDPSFFLSFVERGKYRFSYAAGFSANQLSVHEQERMLPLIEALDTVSVRDSVGKSLLQKLSKARIREDIDPTMLLLSEDWIRLAEPVSGVTEQEFIFCYLLGNSREARIAAKQLKKETGMKIITLPHATTIQHNDVGFGDMRLWDVTPQRFLWLINNASYVITDSFHGCVFSILFRKKFCIFRRFLKSDESELNLRLDCLLDKVGITGRIVSSPEVAVKTVQRKIDYDEVCNKIAEYRKDSLAYLKQITSEQ